MHHGGGCAPLLESGDGIRTAELWLASERAAWLLSRQAVS